MFLKIMFVFLLFLLVFHFVTRKFVNPYTLSMVMGKKGSGKTTLIAKLAYRYQKQGRRVYCTERIPGCYLIGYKDIGVIDIPPHSVLLVDEVGMIWDNRKFKNFSDEVRDWFKLQRHYKVTVWLFSQSFDVDKKIRDLCDDIWIVSKFMRVFSYGKRVRRKLVVVKSSAEAPSRIDEDLVIDSLLFFFLGSRSFTFIPKYAPLFDSFIAPELSPSDHLSPCPGSCVSILGVVREQHRRDFFQFLFNMPKKILNFFINFYQKIIKKIKKILAKSR
jgi:hypothetical protein